MALIITKDGKHGKIHARATRKPAACQMCSTQILHGLENNQTNFKKRKTRALAILLCKSTLNDTAEKAKYFQILIYVV
jgi:hypothetical protein